ncbi:hypothetical protein J6590_064029 [Homalodisca vitripennis]|nr:hypothetical protein J6590_064029 [Homalodisca vitripennis]
MDVNMVEPEGRWLQRVAMVTGAAGGIGRAVSRALVTRGITVVGLDKSDEIETEMDRWQGRVAMVTGARTGIGEAISRALVSYGVLVVGLARNEERLKELEKEMAGQKGKFYGIKTDLTIEEEILSAFRWTEQHVGGIDILVNNAGVSTRTRVLGRIFTNIIIMLSLEMS